jgi:heme exporter protein A
MSPRALSRDSPQTRSPRSGPVGSGVAEVGHYSGRVIRARGLEKRYGDKRALRSAGFELAHDGFLVVTGPNGSGKTTLLRLCAGLAVPTAGELEVSVERGRIGYLAHESLVYRELTALENLDLYGRLYRVPERRERVGMLLERFGLWDARHERAGSYSRGTLQRLALCRTLLHEPDLLVLDEPYSGLDDDGAALLDRELDERRSHSAFIVATHEPERIGRFASARLALG